MKTRLLLLALFGVLPACAPAPAVTEVAVTAVTEVAVTEIMDTPEPIIVLVTATLPPDFTEAYRFEGNGRGSTDLFSLPPNTIARITWNFVGDSNFAFYFQNFDTDVQELIENTIGNADGQRVLQIIGGDNYLFEVGPARGDWVIVVETRPQ